MEKIRKVGFIGAGKVGSALAILLREAGYEIIGVASRSCSSAERLAAKLDVPVLAPGEVARKAEALFLTTSDDALAEVVLQLAKDSAFHSGQIVVHVNGAMSSEVLAPAAAQGAITISLHPLQSFASVEQALAILPGSYFSIEGDKRGHFFAQEIVQKFKGTYFFLDSDAKVLYHAAACVASNYFVALLACSLDFLAAAGIPEEMRLPALLPLVGGTLNNIRKIGIPQALTGPLARGDIGTIQSHLTAMENLPELQDIYNCLGIYTLKVALAKGTISQEQEKALRSLLENNKKKAHNKEES